MHTVYISLGSNMGNRKENLMRAVSLMAPSGIFVDRQSSIYETQPQGVETQPWFLNMVLRARTSLSARELLRTLQDIEAQMGRKRLVRWGPRVIDLDILLFDQEDICEQDLKIPHPQMTERAFVIVPLLEICPDKRMPDGTPLKSFLSLPQVRSQGIRLYERDSMKGCSMKGVE